MRGSIRCSVAAAATLLLKQTLTQSGQLNLLTMNVAGLPEDFNKNGENGNKEANSKLMGTKFAQYGFDVVHMQEDFNYHAAIYDTDTHPYRTSTSGGVPFGSGLNTLSNFQWVDFDRIQWDDCSNDSGADCLTPKGFTFMRIAISGSQAQATSTVYVDFYNLHADAGTKDGDNAARQSNINQVMTYINANSIGNAVIIMGDTNSRYTRGADTAIRDILGIPVTDAWLELERGGTLPDTEVLCDNPSTVNTCETVDKVLYRSSPVLTLKATAFAYVGSNFLDASGNVVSDHNPVNVNMTWTAGATLRQSDFWGGPHGNWFSDVPALDGKTNPKPATLTFRGASRLDSVGITLEDGTTLIHGGTGGDAISLDLAADEYWTEASLCQGQKNGTTRNFSILARTTAGNMVTAGTITDDCRDFMAPEGWHIVGFKGQTGDEVDQLAFVYGLRG